MKIAGGINKKMGKWEMKMVELERKSLSRSEHKPLGNRCCQRQITMIRDCV